MLTLPPRLSLAQTPTPLQFLGRVSEELGVRLWIKRDDLTGMMLSGNKVRKLEFSLARALEQGCDTIITCGGLQSNHCRATAFACAQLGLSCSLILRGENSETADGNLLLDQLAGADISMHRAAHYARNLSQLLEQKAAELTESGRRPYVIPTGASDGTGLWGYLCAAMELRDDFHTHDIRPSHIICASGSGGTQAGLTLGAHLLKMDVDVVGFAVCDDEAYFQSKVRADIEQWQQLYGKQIGEDVDVESLNVIVNDHYIGPGYAKADAEVYETISWLSRLEGIVLDPVYTGKAFYGLVEEIRAGRMGNSGDIVFVHTGGIFGLFPQRQGFESLQSKAQ